MEEEGEAVSRSERRWYVLHVKPRTEKKVFEFLLKYGFYRYLPTWVKETKVQRRKVRRELPIFPGYVFTKLYPDERAQMLKTNLIVHAIDVPRPREMVHQLRQVARAGRAADGIKPASSRSSILMRYPDTHIGAAVRYDAGSYKVAAFGFPLETSPEMESVIRVVLSQFRGD